LGNSNHKVLLKFEIEGFVGANVPLLQSSQAPKFYRGQAIKSLSMNRISGLLKFPDSSADNYDVIKSVHAYLFLHSILLFYILKLGATVLNFVSSLTC
jgi:hypothetical protein